MTKEQIEKRLLLTAAQDDSEYLISGVEERYPHLEIIHLPLEKYLPVEIDGSKEALKESLESMDNIIYGHKRNARFFIRFCEEFGMMDEVRNRVNLTYDPGAAEYLEEYGVPAIYPDSREPIKMLEFMLRLRRTGPTLYPCGTHKKEEIPGLLQELGVEVQEKEIYRLEGPSEEDLETFRKQLEEQHIDLVLFHSRRAVNRVPAAFPDLNLNRPKIIAGDEGSAGKLRDNGIVVDRVAKGSWESVLEVLGDGSSKES